MAQPSISGSDSYLGVKKIIFTYNYTVDDTDNDVVTVVERLNNNVIRTYSPTLGQENTLSFSSEFWSNIPQDSNVITITATDSGGLSVTRTLLFIKNENDPTKMLIRRGTKASLPNLSLGEMGLCTDTNEVYIGTINGNVLIVSGDIDCGSF